MPYFKRNYFRIFGRSQFQALKFFEKNDPEIVNIVEKIPSSRGMNNEEPEASPKSDIQNSKLNLNF